MLGDRKITVLTFKELMVWLVQEKYRLKLIGHGSGPDPRQGRSERGHGTGWERLGHPQVGRRHQIWAVEEEKEGRLEVSAC